MNLFEKEPETPSWGTYIARRTPQSKMHTKLGHAKNAINQKWPNHGGIIYHYNKLGWVVYWEIPAWESCSHCGHHKTDCQLERYWYPGWVVLKKHPNFVDSFVVCRCCYEKHWSYKATERLEKP